MICATCLSATEAVMCHRCGYPSRFEPRHTLLRPVDPSSGAPRFWAQGPTGVVQAEKLAQASWVTHDDWVAASRGLTALRTLDHRALQKVSAVVEAGAGDLRALWVVTEAPPDAATAPLAPLADRELVGTLGDLLEGLAALHLAGLAHGAVSAANLRRRPDGQVMLLGLPLSLRPSATPGEAPNPRQDLYDFGRLTLSLCGEDPDALRHGALGRLDWLPARPVSAEVVALVAALTPKDPRARPPDAGAALAQFANLFPRHAERAKRLTPPAAAPAAPAPLPLPEELPGPARAEAGPVVPRPAQPRVLLVAAGVMLGLGLGVAGSAGAARNPEGPAATLGGEDAARARALLVEDLLDSRALRLCGQQWRDRNPDAPADEPHVHVVLGGDGTVYAGASDDARGDLGQELPACTRGALAQLRGPDGLVFVEGRRLEALDLSLGPATNGRVRDVWAGR